MESLTIILRGCHQKRLKGLSVLLSKKHFNINISINLTKEYGRETLNNGNTIYNKFKII